MKQIERSPCTSSEAAARKPIFQEDELALLSPIDALNAGTMFASLQVPFIMEGTAAPLSEDDLECYALPFAAWDIRMYLDTHPQDRNALAMYHYYCEKCPEGYGFLACALYNRDKTACPLCWTWLDGSCPWESLPYETREEG